MGFHELKKEVFALFAERLDRKRWCYHSLEHTAFVLEDILTFGRASKVTPAELELLRIAALFHDTGYIFDPGDHERASAVFARERLSASGMPDEDIASVERLILATRLPTAPAGLLEELICDADIGQMATGRFLYLGAKLRREMEQGGRVFDDAGWCLVEWDFYRRCRLCSPAARLLRQEGWERNREFFRLETERRGRGAVCSM